MNNCPWCKGFGRYPGGFPCCCQQYDIDVDFKRTLFGMRQRWHLSQMIRHATEAVRDIGKALKAWWPK